MAVQVAAEIGALDERRQLPFPRRIELAAVLAQLGRDVGIAEVRVQLFLVGSCELLTGLGRLDEYSETEKPADGVIPAARRVVLRP